MRGIFFSLLICFCCQSQAWAKIKVVATTTTLESVVKAVGGEHVEAHSIARGSQDPHYVEAKPSYMVTLRDADLLVVVGLDLEVGWVSNVARGARNPKILPGKSGYFDAGSLIGAIEIPQGRVDRSMGDIHPGGNPHFYLDPVRIKTIAKALVTRLSQLDLSKKAQFEKNYLEFEKTIDQKMSEWQSRIQKSKVRKIITYHRTLNYFLKRFGLEFAGSIEPKPGIPPTARHILSVIDLMNKEKVSCILVESFFEMKPAKRLQKDTAAHAIRVPTEVGSLPGTETYVLLIDQIVKAVESCGKSK